jgi:peroxiredoxin
MTRLSPGDAFPALTVQLPGGSALELPAAVGGHYAVVLFYRGSWCPYCNAQLRAFRRAEERLARDVIRVVALSVDDEATTRRLVEEHELPFPVGFGADGAALAKATGAFVDPERGYLESTGFVLDPDGRVVVSVYSSGAIGRLVPDDVIGLVRHLKETSPSHG